MTEKEKPDTLKLAADVLGNTGDEPLTEKDAVGFGARITEGAPSLSGSTQNFGRSSTLPPAAETPAQFAGRLSRDPLDPNGVPVVQTQQEAVGFFATAATVPDPSPPQTSTGLVHLGGKSTMRTGVGSVGSPDEKPLVQVEVTDFREVPPLQSPFDDEVDQALRLVRPEK